MPGSAAFLNTLSGVAIDNVLGGTTSLVAINGVVSFTGLTVSKPGMYLLHITGPNLAGTFAIVNVNAVPASRLAFIASPPKAITAGGTFAVSVSAENAAGNPDPNFNGTVTLSLLDNPADGTVGGTLIATAVNGVAIFNDLKIDKAGVDYALQASGSGLMPATTSPFAVTAVGVAIQLAVTTQPASYVNAENGFSLIASAVDGLGNIDNSFDGIIGLTLASGGPSLLDGPLTVRAINGLATFSGIRLDQAGAGYSLSVTTAGLNGATSAPFVVLPATAMALGVVAPSSNVLANVPFSLMVNVKDSYGRLVTSFNGPVTLSLHNNSGATLGGVLTSTALNGVATFDGLTLSNVGDGITIQANSLGLRAGTSEPFAVTKDQLVITAQPTANVTAGSAIGLTVAAKDGSGAIDTSFGGAVTLTPDAFPQGSISTYSGGVTAVAVHGFATFSGITFPRSGEYSFDLSSPSLGGTVTNPIIVSSSAATELQVIKQPGAATVGAPFEIDVAVEDASGKVDTTFSGSVALYLSSSANGAMLGGVFSATAVDGLAIFSGLTINQPGTGDVITAMSVGLSPGTTRGFSVTPRGLATHFVVTTQPSAAVVVHNGFGFVVAAEDDFGSVDATFGGTVRISTPSWSRLSGIQTANAVNGMVTFSGLTLDQAKSGIFLSVSSSGLATTTTDSFDVIAGKATHLVVQRPGDNVLPGSPFTLEVQAEDEFGNVDPSYSGSVTLSLTTGPGMAPLGGMLTIQAVNGIAHFTGLTLSNVAAGYSIQAAGNGLTLGESALFDVTSDELRVTSMAPFAVTPNALFSLTVSAEDASGNVDTAYNGKVEVSLINSGINTAALGGTLSVQAINGRATFTDLSLNQTGDYALLATGIGIGATATDLVTVMATATVVGAPIIGFGSGFVLGGTQRSQVRDIVLHFNTAVTLASGAVTLGAYSGNDTTGTLSDASVALGASTTLDGGFTWVIPILANTAFSTPDGSLNDGIYKAVLHASAVTGSSINVLSFRDQSVTFHRLFGDIDGNGVVNSADYFKFKAAFGSISGAANFNSDFDFDGNGKINSADYFRFKANFGRKFAY